MKSSLMTENLRRARKKHKSFVFQVLSKLTDRLNVVPTFAKVALA